MCMHFVFLVYYWLVTLKTFLQSKQSIKEKEKNVFIVIGLPNLGPSRFKLRFPSWPLQHHIKIDCSYTWCYVRKIGSPLIWRLPFTSCQALLTLISFLGIYLMLYSTWRWRWLCFHLFHVNLDYGFSLKFLDIVLDYNLF